MDREKALFNAITRAQKAKEIIIVYRDDNGQWHTIPYNSVRDMDRLGDTRYVLPHGEVTKLS